MMLPNLSWRQKTAALALLAAAAVLLVLLPGGSSAAQPAPAARAALSLTDSMPLSRVSARVHTAGRLSAIRVARAAARKAAATASAARQAPASPAPVSSPPAWPSGVLSAAQVGALWRAAGGSVAAEATAECIAWHESGDDPSKISPTDDWGLWQINRGNGGHVIGGATIVISLSPSASARDAVAISRDGTDWSAWTTARDCGV